MSIKQNRTLKQQNASAEEADAITSVKKQLKKLRKKIKKVIKQRDKKMQEVKRQTIKKYEILNKKIQKIVDGAIYDEQSYVQKSGQIIINDQKLALRTGPCQNLEKTVKNQGISDYWKKILYMEYKASLRKADIQLLEYLRNISIIQYDESKISLQFSFRAGHKSIPQGQYIKTINLDANQNPVSYDGSLIPQTAHLPQCVFKLILGQMFDSVSMTAAYQFFLNISTQLMPNSFSLYMKARKIQMFGQELQNSSQFQNSDANNNSQYYLESSSSSSSAIYY